MLHLLLLLLILLLQVVEENKKLSEKITGLADELAKKTSEEIKEMNDLNEVKGSKTELYIENESFSENGGLDHALHSTSETVNGKYDCESEDFDKTDNDLVSSRDSIDVEDMGDDDDDEEGQGQESDLGLLLREGERLRGVVEEMARARTKTDHELVNLRINLEEARNENTTVLQVSLEVVI